MNQNATIINRISRAVTAFRRNPVDMVQLSKDIDDMIRNKGLMDAPEEQKQADSKLNIRSTTHDLQYAYTAAYTMLRGWVDRQGHKRKDVPPRDDPSRDEFIAEIWKDEPILAGAVYSMTAKMAALKWSITGKRLQAMKAAKLLSRAAYYGPAYDWGGFIASTAQDYYTVNRGVFWEAAREGDPLLSPLADLGFIDALCCTLTGNSTSPVVYVSQEVGQVIRFKPGEFIHFASMPSPRERYLGAGLCAADRCYRAAALLMGLHDYDTEKLNNLPPEGVAAVSGLTMDEFTDAVALWKAQRQADNSLTFPQVLWLIGSQPSSSVSVNLTPFSTLPEQFNRKEVVDQYINTIALDFGVDAREFWSLMSGGGLGTAGESEVQHLKAKGKGPGEFISTVERHINGELPEDCDFGFDTQDIEEDANAAAVAKAWVDAFLPLYNLKPAGAGGPGGGAFKANPQPDKPNGAPKLPTTPLPKVKTGGAMGVNEGGQPAPQAEQVITKEQFLRILADKGVIPDWMVNDERVLVQDTDVHNRAYKGEGHPDDVTRYTWKNGVLKEERAAPIVITSPIVENNASTEEESQLQEVPEPATSSRLEFLLESLREVKQSENNQPVVHIHMPDGNGQYASKELAPIQVNVPQAAPPIINVTTPSQPPPVVNVENKVDVNPTPVTVENKVNVQPTPVQASLRIPQVGSTMKVERDEQGRIVSAEITKG